MASRLAPDEALGSISRQYHHPALARQERRAHGLVGLLLLDRLRWGFLLSVPLLAVAVGTYQAYASLVIALMLARGVLLIVADERDDRALLGLAARYLLATAASLGLYYVLAGAL